MVRIICQNDGQEQLDFPLSKRVRGGTSCAQVRLKLWDWRTSWRARWRQWIRIGQGRLRMWKGIRIRRRGSRVWVRGEEQWLFLSHGSLCQISARTTSRRYPSRLQGNSVFAQCTTINSHVMRRAVSASPAGMRKKSTLLTRQTLSAPRRALSQARPQRGPRREEE